MKKFYSKFFALLCTLMMVAGSAFAQDGIEMPFGSGTYQGINYHCASGDWSTFCTLWGNGGSSDYYGTLKLSCTEKKIAKVVMTCQSAGGDTPFETCMSTLYENDNKQGTLSIDGNTATWEGSAASLCFSASESVLVSKYVVYLGTEEVAKECTVGVDYYGDNCKPGKHEGELTSSMTLYMQSTTVTSNWTGSANCPEGVTFTTEDGEEATVEQLNYWTGSNQIGIKLSKTITTPGTYTLHIPEGIVPFQGGKWNKEINVTWTVVAPDLRTKIAAQFDLAKEDYDKSAVVSYMGKELGEVTLETDGLYNETINCLRVGKGKTLSFSAPAQASIVKVALNNTSGSYTFAGATADSGECTEANSSYLSWEGDASSVVFTFTANAAITSATVTLADEGILTGIDTVLSTEASNKVYDLIGRRVVNAQNGLFIVNGKKVIR